MWREAWWPTGGGAAAGVTRVRQCGCCAVLAWSEGGGRWGRVRAWAEAARERGVARLEVGEGKADEWGRGGSGSGVDGGGSRDSELGWAAWC
jgi:hypothetical protein